MSKILSAWFAFSSIILLLFCAVAISYSAWLAILLGVVAIGNIGWGFVIKAKQQRRSGNHPA
ncbi:hypothetical protein ACE3MZ_19055 [Paenibacillus sp. WLX1005]|uniref:hypothetical protein n=1 Tax=Paenibacillus sp. WLX1005 TaxID=3243766 RepID=UPI0039845D31